MSDLCRVERGKGERECVLFNVYMDEVMKEVKVGIGRKGESGDGGSARCGRGIGV